MGSGVGTGGVAVVAVVLVGKEVGGVVVAVVVAVVVVAVELVAAVVVAAVGVLFFIALYAFFAALIAALSPPPAFNFLYTALALSTSSIVLVVSIFFASTESNICEDFESGWPPLPERSHKNFPRAGYRRVLC